jgi:hypothetical protein
MCCHYPDTPAPNAPNRAQQPPRPHRSLERQQLPPAELLTQRLFAAAGGEPPELAGVEVNGARLASF